MSLCVCVQAILKKSENTERETEKSQDGNVCVNSDTLAFLKTLSLTTTVTMHFASRVVGEVTTSASTLLAQTGVRK